METVTKAKKTYIRADIIYALYLPLILLGKLIRFTIMKDVLVNEGAGHGILVFALERGEIPKEGTGRILLSFVQFFNFFGAETYMQFEVVFTVIWNLFTFFLLMKMKKYLTYAQALFLIFSILVLNIFSFTLSKEPIQMLYFILIYAILCNQGLPGQFKFILSVAVFFFASMTFRKYYFMIAYYMLIINFILFRVMKKKFNVLVVFGLLLLISGAAYYAILFASRIANPKDYAELLRVRTTRGSARTVISPSIQGSSLITLSTNYLIVLIRMLFPIELIAFGIKYFPYVLYQLIITTIFLRNLAMFKMNPHTINLAMIVYFSFLNCSAAFEPDFGSWVRHESVVFPVFLIMTMIKPVKEYSKGRQAIDTRTAYLQAFRPRRGAREDYEHL